MESRYLGALGLILAVGAACSGPREEDSGELRNGTRTAQAPRLDPRTPRIGRGAFSMREHEGVLTRLDRQHRYGVPADRQSVEVAGTESPIAVGDTRITPEGFSLIHLAKGLPRPRQWISGRGLTPVEYLGSGGWLVHRDSTVPPLDVSTPEVDWIRTWTPELKWHATESPPSGQVFRVLELREQEPDSRQEIHRRLVSATSASELADDPTVFFIEPYLKPTLLSGVQKALSLSPPDANGWHPSGESFAALEELSDLPLVQIDVVDSGFDSGQEVSHPGLPRPVASWNWTAEGGLDDASGHGTFLAGLIVGTSADGTTDDSGFSVGAGLIPTARFSFSKVFDGLDFKLGNHSFFEVATQSLDQGAQIFLASWGAAAQGAYTSWSQDFDAIVRDADGDSSNELSPLVVVVAAGNGGPARSLDAPGTAKNVITVGASEGLVARGFDGCMVSPDGADNGGDVARISSRGPTEDQRIKPDLVAPGTHIIAARSQSTNYNGSGLCDSDWRPRDSDSTLYTAASGTSPAAALVAGAASVVMASHHERYGEWPSPALVRGTLIAHALDLQGGATGTPELVDFAPSSSQGWGRLSLNRLLVGAPRVLYDQEFLFENTADFLALPILRVASEDEPVRIVLTWTDPPGGLSGGALVNDLDLFVAVDGVAYFGNVFESGHSIPGGEFDYRNNVEVFELELPQGTQLEVEVIAAELVGDGVPGNASAVDQDFALYAYNVTASTACIEDEECDGGGCLVGTCTEGFCLYSEQCASSDACSLSGCFFAQDRCLQSDRSCDDGNSCSDDICDEQLGCIHEARENCSECDSGRCLDGVCGSPGAFEMNELPPEFSTSSARPWKTSAEESFSGNHSLSSGAIFNGESSSLTYEFTLPERGEAVFSYQLESQEDSDHFYVELDEVEVLRESGLLDWREFRFSVDAGEHELRFVYEKDESGATGRDRVWIDDLEFMPCATESCSLTALVRGECIECAVEEGESCTPSDPCLEGRACVDGTCGVPRSCDDDDPCTLDTCDSSGTGCQHAAVECDEPSTCEGADCDDASDCMGSECEGLGGGPAALEDDTRENASSAGGCGCRMGSGLPRIPWGPVVSVLLLGSAVGRRSKRKIEGDTLRRQRA